MPSLLPHAFSLLQGLEIDGDGLPPPGCSRVAPFEDTQTVCAACLVGNTGFLGLAAGLTALVAGTGSVVATGTGVITCHAHSELQRQQPPPVWRAWGVLCLRALPRYGLALTIPLDVKSRLQYGSGGMVCPGNGRCGLVARQHPLLTPRPAGNVQQYRCHGSDSGCLPQRTIGGNAGRSCGGAVGALAAEELSYPA